MEVCKVSLAEDMFDGRLAAPHELRVLCDPLRHASCTSSKARRVMVWLVWLRVQPLKSPQRQLPFGSRFWNLFQRAPTMLVAREQRVDRGDDEQG